MIPATATFLLRMMFQCLEKKSQWTSLFIGPCEIDVPSIGAIIVRALTIVDTCTTLTELTRIENLSAADVTFKFKQS
jgi:hypothetical protein